MQRTKSLLANKKFPDLFTYEFVGFDRQLVHDCEGNREFVLDKKTNEVVCGEIIAQDETFKTFRVKSAMKFVLLLDGLIGKMNLTEIDMIYPCNVALDVLELEFQMN